MSEIIDALDQTWTSLDAVLAGLTDEEWERQTGCPGWNVHDQVSHIIGVEISIERDDPAPGHHIDTTGMSEAGVAMEPAVDYRRSRSHAEVLAEFRAVTAASLVRRRASDIPPEQEAEGPFGWRMPIWRLLGIRVFDTYAHEQDIRRALGRPGNLDGAAADVSWDRIVEALPFLLPERLPELAERPVDFVVRGRTVRAGGEGDPATTLTMDFGTFVPFVCGRADARVEDVSIAGDTDLGRRVLAAIGFTP
jgi:uncharacterized protein (TIGR03083 family)